jgi:hypothetical protein
MTQRSNWESFKVEGGQLIDRGKELFHEGNVRRVVIRRGDRVIAEFPLTLGVIGAVIAPALAAAGALAALVTDCTIEVERAGHENGHRPTEAPTVTAEEIVDT